MTDIEITIAKMNDMMAAVVASEPPTTLLVRRDMADRVAKLLEPITAKHNKSYRQIAIEAVRRFNGDKKL